MCDPRGLDYRRALLAVGEAIRLVFVGVDAAELFAVRVINCHQKMMMLPALIFAEISRFFLRGLFCWSFCH